MAGVRRGLCVGAAIALTAACTEKTSSPLMPTPTATPSPVVATATLTVTVLTRTTDLPIPRAVVLNTGQSVYTDVSGQATLEVPTGQDTSVDVSATGYESMGASGVLMNNERWTFYLAPDPQP